MNEHSYTVVIDGKPQGPFDIEELKRMGIRPGTFVRRPGMDDYKEAHEMEELREVLGFKFQPTAPQYFAAFDQRVVADIIDVLVILAGYLVLMILLYFVTAQFTFSVLAIAGLVLVGFARLIYGSIAEASPKQATIGKRLMDLKVTDTDGNRLTLANSFGRNFAKIVTNITLGFGYLYLFLNKKQQCLHDLIANAVVIKQRLL